MSLDVWAQIVAPYSAVALARGYALVNTLKLFDDTYVDTFHRDGTYLDLGGTVITDAIAIVATGDRPAVTAAGADLLGRATRDRPQ